MGRLLGNLLVRYPAVAWMLAAIGVVFLFVGMGQLRDFHHLEQTGVKTQGTLTAITGDPNAMADLVYTFDVAGKHYTGDGEVGAHERASFHLGDKVEVRYIMGNPKQNIMGSTRPSHPYIFVLLGVTLMLMPFANMVRQRHDRRQQGTG